MEGSIVKVYLVFVQMKHIPGRNIRLVKEKPRKLVNR